MLSISYELTTTFLVLTEITEVNCTCLSEVLNVIDIHAYILTTRKIIKKYLCLMRYMQYIMIDR